MKKDNIFGIAGKFDLMRRERGDLELAYLNTNDLTSGLWIMTEDLERPGIAISFVEAALYLDPEVLEGANEDDAEVRMGMVNFWGHMDPEKYPDWTNWCIALRVHLPNGEIRETAWDADEQKWVAPWFTLHTGEVNDTHKFQAA